MRKAFQVSVLALAAIIFSAQASDAASIVFTNKTGHCVWATFYWKHAWGWDIEHRGWVAPGKVELYGKLCNDCRIKVRAEVMPGSACTGNSSDRIDDVDYITDLNHDPLNLIKNANGRFQIKRYG